jgi:hypothetical protein
MAKARGSLYRQPKSPFWWMSYYVDGKQIRQSTKKGDLKEAQQVLAEKVVVNEVPDKRTIGALLDGLIADYENNHRKSIDWVKRMVRVHLREPFGNVKIDAITKQMVLDFMDTQRKRGAKNALRCFREVTQ